MSERNWLERSTGAAARGFTGYGGSVLPVLGSACLAVGAVLMPESSTVGWWLFWCGVAVTALGIAAMVALRPSYWSLRRENERLERDVEASRAHVKKQDDCLTEERRAHKTALVAMLNHVARRALSEAHPAGDLDRSRISIYVDRGGELVLVARWSQNERLRRPGRQRFPQGQGLIGEAWNGVRGAACVYDLPADADAWDKHQQLKYGFSAEEVAKLTMRPRSMSAVRVDGDRKTSIVIIESLEPKLLNLRATLSLRECEPYQEIARIISDAEIIIPEVHETLP